MLLTLLLLHSEFFCRTLNLFVYCCRSSQTYYMFGFLFLVFIILVITCSETTVLLCYFHLCAEVIELNHFCYKIVLYVSYYMFLINFCLNRQDYHWWWRSFLTSGFTSFYLFVYCIHYFETKLNIEDAASTFLYFGYTLIIVFLFFLLTGKSKNLSS